MSNQIIIPQILIEQKNYCLRINDNNQKMFEHIDYLRQLVTNMHQIYLRLCKRMITLTDEYERKINSLSKVGHGLVILNFIKSMNFLHMTINNQLNNNNVTLGTKTHKIAKNRLQILRDKLIKSDELNKIYLEKVQIYNEKEKKLRDKCDYFKDYQKDVIKYYSLKGNTELYEKLSSKELRLKAKLQDIYQIKDEYKVNVSQIRATQKEYFEMEKNTVSQYRKLLLNIRKAGNQSNQIYNQPIIQERSEDANSSVIDVPLKTGRSERQYQSEKVISVLSMRKELMKQFQKCVSLQEIFQDFINNMQQEVAVAGQKIDEIRSATLYSKFISQKLVMSQILSFQSIKDIDLIINEVSFFRTIILNLSSIFGKIKVLQELKKYCGFNYVKFIEDTTHFVDLQKRNGLSMEMKAQYKNFEEKFEASNNEYIVRFREKIIELQTQIIQEYYREDLTYEEFKNKKIFKNDLFEKKYFEILMNPFFLSKQDNLNFRQNIYLKKYSALLNANQIQKMITLTGFKKKATNGRVKTTCCGLRRVDQYEEKGPELIDEFHCALKDGFILIQGKLKLYSNYLNFSSSFNSKTLFGFSDIRIPKWDISQFIKDKHVFSLMIVIQTTHGNIEFTSFLNDPYQHLLELYDNRKSGVSFINKNTDDSSQLQILQGRFQSELQLQLKKSGMIVDKLSTYLTEDKMKLSISIQYHFNGSEQRMLFEIKINQTDISIEYFFIHDEFFNYSDIKAKLESISKEIINRKHEIRPMTNRSKEEDLMSLQFEFSMIEPKEINKISFMKEPSFINRKSDSLIIDENMKNSQRDFNLMFSSRNYLSGADTSRNQQLQQRLSSSKIEDTPFSRVRSQSDFLPKIKILTPTPLTNEVELTPRTQSLQTGKSRKSAGKVSRTGSHSSTKSAKGLSDYKGILYILGIVLGLNILLRIFN